MTIEPVVCILRRHYKLNLSHCEASILFWFSEQQRGGVGRAPQDACSLLSSSGYLQLTVWVRRREMASRGAGRTEVNLVWRGTRTTASISSTDIDRYPATRSPGASSSKSLPQSARHVVIGSPHNTSSMICSGRKCFAVVRLALVLPLRADRLLLSLRVVPALYPSLLHNTAGCFEWHQTRGFF